LPFPSVFDTISVINPGLVDPTFNSAATTRIWWHRDAKMGFRPLNPKLTLQRFSP
jgi:hypothetical protein